MRFSHSALAALFGAAKVWASAVAKRGGGYDDDYSCGHAVVVNKCGYDVYLWSVGSYDTDGPYFLGRDSYYKEEFQKGGVAIEITDDYDADYNKGCEDYCDPKLIFYYKLDTYHDKVFYDLKEKEGSPFKGDSIVLKPEDDYCPKVVWPDGCDDGDHEKNCCDDDKDLVLYLCAKHYDDKKYGPHKGKGKKRGPAQLDDNEQSAEHADDDLGHLAVRDVLPTTVWEQDKPAWDTDAPCSASVCGPKVKGVVISGNYPDDASA